LSRQRLPGNLAVNFRFDPQGSLVRVVDPKGREFDQVFQPASGQLRANSRLTEFDEFQGNQLVTDTLFRYDPEGNLTSIQYPDGPPPESNPGAGGTLRGARNRRDQLIRYTYDARGLVTRRTHADGSHEDYTYDDRGNLLTATDENGTTTYEYDAGDRLV